MQVGRKQDAFAWHPCTRIALVYRYGSETRTVLPSVKARSKSLRRRQRTRAFSATQTYISVSLSAMGIPQASTNAPESTTRYMLYARGYPPYPPLGTFFSTDSPEATIIRSRTQDAAEIQQTEAQIREIIGPNAQLRTSRTMAPIVSHWLVYLDQAQLERVRELHGVCFESVIRHGRRQSAQGRDVDTCAG